MRKLWGGAFEEDSDSLVNDFGQSIESDLRFWREDVVGSIAHARMLGDVGILTPAESAQLIEGLNQILEEGPDSLPKDVEDIHTSVEIRLGAIVGEVAGKLHTARSRNDQVATDCRLILRRFIGDLTDKVKSLQDAILLQAASEKETILPGVTHQQHAQPITVGFHLLAYFFALQRHGWRLAQIDRVIAGCPLGSGALAGTGFPIDRQQTAAELGFLGPTANALDSTSDRSFALDYLHVCSLIMIDLSRLAQEFVSWSAPDFGFIDLPDSMTTGSSIMPQKRNPDMAELIRGRTGQAVGNWVSLATTMKGLVYGYNRDTQDDKPALFASHDVTLSSLRLMEMMVGGVIWNRERMSFSTAADFSTATDLADLLAREGMAFREAHEKVGQIVRHCMSRGIGLEGLSGGELRKLTESDIKDFTTVTSPQVSAASRNSFGGTGVEAVNEQIRIATDLLEQSGFSSPDQFS